MVFFGLLGCYWPNVLAVMLFAAVGSCRMLCADSTAWGVKLFWFSSGFCAPVTLCARNVVKDVEADACMHDGMG
jgi:hypothetical protein